jgi:hypothetical protein
VFVIGGIGRVRGIAALATVGACLLAASPSLASGSRSVNGPRKVWAGQRVSYSLGGMLADKPTSIVVQPRQNAGGNCCGIQVKGRWRTTTSGSFHARFRFPRRYFFGCYAGGCQGQDTFLPGSRAVI